MSPKMVIISKIEKNTQKCEECLKWCGNKRSLWKHHEDLKALMSLKDELAAKDSLIKKLEEIMEYIEIIALSTNCW